MMVGTCGTGRWFGSGILAAHGLAFLFLYGTVAGAADSTWIDEAPQSVLIGDGGPVLGDVGAIAADPVTPPLGTPNADGESVTALAADLCACDSCRQGQHCHDDTCCRLRDCDPPGLFQRLAELHDETGACWSGRFDALLLWRNAPPGRPIVEGGTDALPKLNANQMDSTPAAGPRISLFRTDRCGDAWEVTWLQAANFRSQRPLPATNQQYVLSNPGIFGNAAFQPFDSGVANLGSRVQSLELNYHLRHSQHVRWIAGYRWVEWQEQFTLYDQVTTVAPAIEDLYQTGCINSMYGGQIGADVYLLSLPWLRVDSVVKAGAYYNNAVQSSVYTTNDPANPGSAAITVGQSPASCAFIGEVGLTGAIPITSCLDFRFGYFGLWLSGIAQPTQQLSGQVLNPAAPPSGTIATNGGVVLQGVTLGLEGRW